MSWLKNRRIMARDDSYIAWMNEVGYKTPASGFLGAIVGTIVEGFLRARSWDVSNAYEWVSQFREIVGIFTLSHEDSSAGPNKDGFQGKRCAGAWRGVCRVTSSKSSRRDQ